MLNVLFGSKFESKVFNLKFLFRKPSQTFQSRTRNVGAFSFSIAFDSLGKNDSFSIALDNLGKIDSFS